ncbi:NAD(P)/FAD-dependent oxidoreductase [Chloroflexota bacterium]
MLDVIIIGGGPAGSYAAYRLGMMGHKVTVLEKKPGIGKQVCCTGIIGLECVRSFNIRDDVILRKVNSARLFSPSGQSIKLWRGETQAAILDRAALDMAMASQAQSAGVEYLLDSPVTDIEIRKDSVAVVDSRQKPSLIARAVIIASGFGSGLGEKLGLGKIGDFVMGAQTEVNTTGVDEVEVYFGHEVAPGFFAWLVPTAPGTARVGLLSRRNSKAYLDKLIISLLNQGKLVSSEAKVSCGGIPLKPPVKTYGERLLAVGDAAGQVKPTSGGGIYYSLLCADIAADVLHQALESDDLSYRRLASYEQRWRRCLSQELRIGYWARKLFERLSDKQLDRIFEIVTANGIDEALLKASDLSFDWHSKAVLRLMGHQVITRAMDVIKIPFRTGAD